MHLHSSEFPDYEVSPTTPQSATSSPSSPKPNPFQSLIRSITTILGPHSGIDSPSISPSTLISLMKSYTSSDPDWLRYAFADPSLVFTRNLIDRGNGRSNLLILVWTPGRESPIHDHADAHCVMKVLRGCVTETRYEWPVSASAPAAAPSSESARLASPAPPPLQQQMHITKTTTHRRDQVTYMSDKLGLHKISNPSADEFAVTLHLYTPPNAEGRGCMVFDEGTGEKTVVKGYGLYSEHGVKNS